MSPWALAGPGAAGRLEHLRFPFGGSLLCQLFSPSSPDHSLGSQHRDELFWCNPNHTILVHAKSKSPVVLVPV